MLIVCGGFDFFNDACKFICTASMHINMMICFSKGNGGEFADAVGATSNKDGFGGWIGLAMGSPV